MSDKMPLKEFINEYCQITSVEDLVGLFFDGDASKAAMALNTTQEQVLEWMEDELI